MISNSKSTIFLTPLITYQQGGDYKTIHADKDLFKRTFIGIENQENNSQIILHYNFKGKKDYLHNRFHTLDLYEKELETKFPFNCNVIDPDNTSVLFIYSFNELSYDLRYIYELFIKGKYSLFPENYKKHILNFWGYSKHTRIAQILYKTEGLRKILSNELNCHISADAELYDAPYYQDEIFKEEMKVNKNQLKMFNYENKSQ